MGTTQRSTIKTHQDGEKTLFQPSSDEILADNIYSDDFEANVQLGISPLSSSNAERVEALNKKRIDTSQLPLFDDGSETEIYPSVAYVDLDGLIEDDELYLGSLPDGKDGSEDPGEYQDRVQRALRAHVENTMDDGQGYNSEYDMTRNPKLNPLSPEYDPKLAEEAREFQQKGGDTEFGDEVSELDDASPDVLRSLLEDRGIKADTFGEGKDAEEQMRRTLRTKLLMDFEASAMDETISQEDADALQEQFKNGTILVKDDKESRENQDGATQAVIENYVIAGQLDGDGNAQTLSAVDALDLAQATLQNYEGIPEETHLDQVWDDYINNEAAQAYYEGSSDLYEAATLPQTSGKDSGQGPKD